MREADDLLCSESWTLFFTSLFCNSLVFNILILCFPRFFTCFVPNLSRIKISLLTRYQVNMDEE